MAHKFVNELRKGDVVVFEDTILQSIKSIHSGSGKTTLVEFENGKVMLTGNTTQYPIVACKVDVTLSIEEVYNMILDDSMSLTEFTVWVTAQK